MAEDMHELDKLRSSKEYLGFVSRVDKKGRRHLIKDPELTSQLKTRPSEMSGNVLVEQTIYPLSSSPIWKEYIANGNMVKGFMQADNVLYWSALKNSASSHGDIIKASGVQGNEKGEATFTLSNIAGPGEKPEPYLEVAGCNGEGERLALSLIKYIARSVPDYENVKLWVSYSKKSSGEYYEFDGKMEEFLNTKDKEV